MGWDTQAPVGNTLAGVAALGSSIRSGTSAENDAYTGAEGEMTFDITNTQVRIHDGSTVGGTVIGSTSGGSSAFGGALLQLTSPEVITTGVATPVPWDAAEYDTDSYFSLSAQTRLTVPAGVSHVQLSGGVFWGFAQTSERAIYFTKAGSIDFPGNARESDFGDNGYQAVSSGVLAVSEDDYFEMVVKTQSVSNKTLAVQGTNFFSIHKVAGT